MTGPLDRLDASEYGDPEGRPSDVGPPCAYCKSQEAVTTSDQGRPICESCLPPRPDLPDGWAESPHPDAGGVDSYSDQWFTRSARDGDSPEIVYVPGAVNHYKYAHDVVVLDAELRAYPLAHEMILRHELDHADCDGVLDHLALEVRTDWRRHFGTDPAIAQVREYYQERSGGEEIGVVTEFGRAAVNTARSLWSVPMGVAGRLSRFLRSGQA